MKRKSSKRSNGGSLQIDIPQYIVQEVENPKIFPLPEERGLYVLEKSIRRIKATKDWQFPAGLLLTLLYTLTTADFKEDFFIPPEYLTAGTVILLLVSIGWSVFALVNKYKNRGITPNKILGEMKNGDSEQIDRKV